MWLLCGKQTKLIASLKPELGNIGCLTLWGLTWKVRKAISLTNIFIHSFIHKVGMQWEFNSILLSLIWKWSLCGFNTMPPGCYTSMKLSGAGLWIQSYYYSVIQNVTYDGIPRNVSENREQNYLYGLISPPLSLFLSPSMIFALLPTAMFRIMP